MDILIEIADASQNIIDENKVFWKLLSRRTVTLIGLQFFFGVVVIISGIATDYTFKSEINGNIKIFKLNQSISVGLAFILLAIIYLSHTIISKNKFFQRAAIRANHAKLNSNIASIVIDEVGVKYSDHELSVNMKWSMFSHYKFYKNYLFLILVGNYLSSMIIKKSFLKNEDFSELSNFLKRNLIEKK